MLDVAVQEDKRAPDLIELAAYWPHSTVLPDSDCRFLRTVFACLMPRADPW